VRVVHAGLSDGLEGRSLTLARKWLKFFRHLNHRERSLGKLPLLILAIGVSDMVEKLASHLAQPCGKLPAEFLVAVHWLPVLYLRPIQSMAALSLSPCSGHCRGHRLLSASIFCSISPFLRISILLLQDSSSSLGFL
jgi:hypothetical protein